MPIYGAGIYLPTVNDSLGGSGEGAPAGPTYDEEVLADDPLFYLPLTDASGTTAAALVGANGTYNGTPALASRPGPDGALYADFDGSNDYVAVPSTGLTATDSVTCDMLVFTDKPTGLAGVAMSQVFGGSAVRLSVGQGGLASQTGALGLDGWEFGVFTSAWSFDDSGAANQVDPFRWYHIALVHTHGAAPKFYVNGVHVGTGDSVKNGSANGLAFNIGRDHAGGNSWDGSIGRVAFYRTALSDARIAAHYDASGIADLDVYNADAPLTIPTYEASNQALHPSVVDFGAGETWNGHRYWMAMTPYPNGNDAVENPSILVSSDGTTWTVPAGLTNPIDAQPGGGHNADTELVYDPVNDKLWCFYIDIVGSTARVLVRGSADGITWGSEVQCFSTATGTSLAASPTVIWDGSQFVMWYVDITNSPNTLRRRTCATADGTWSAASSALTFTNISATRDLWHIYILKNGADYLGLFDYCSIDNNGLDFNTLHLASSSDGLTWTVDPVAILAPRQDSWDDRLIYRAAGVVSGANLDTWYSTTNADGTSDIARTSWPLSLFP